MHKHEKHDHTQSSEYEDTRVHPHEHGHDHLHGVISPQVASSERGLWAVKWSFWGLLLAALLQVSIFYWSNSISLLADTIHNFGDAGTAIPLAIAFVFSRMKPTRRFSYG